MTGSYKATFYVAGSFVIFSAGILLLNCCVGSKSEANEKTVEISLEHLLVIEKETVL